MSQTAAIWLLVLLALATANLPFLLERPLLVLPWRRAGQSARPTLLRALAFLMFLGLLYGFHVAAQFLIGQALATGGSALQSLLFLLRIVGLVAAAGLLLAFAGWWLGAATAGVKPFFERLLEMLVLYGLVGALGFAFEAYMGNVFAQGWEFYVTTFSLYLVMGYPGFVYRYLFQRRKRRVTPAGQEG